jgi:hypothetical protein
MLVQLPGVLVHTFIGFTVYPRWLSPEPNFESLQSEIKTQPKHQYLLDPNPERQTSPQSFINVQLSICPFPGTQYPQRQLLAFSFVSSRHFKRTIVSLTILVPLATLPLRRLNLNSKNNPPHRRSSSGNSPCRPSSWAPGTPAGSCWALSSSWPAS